MRTLAAALLAALCAACGASGAPDEPAARVEPLYLAEVLGPVTSARRPHGSSVAIAWTFTSKPTRRRDDGDPIGRRVADRLARRWLDRR